MLDKEQIRKICANIETQGDFEREQRRPPGRPSCLTFAKYFGDLTVAQNFFSFFFFLLLWARFAKCVIPVELISRSLLVLEKDFRSC